MNRFLVTGGAGFIGSNIVRKFSQKSRVVISDRLESGSKWTNLIDVSVEDIISPDFTLDWLRAEDRSISAVIHMGAISSTTETNVDRLVENNIRFTFDIWKHCCDLEIPFIYASSAATYGNGESGFIDDDCPDALMVLRPLNAYGWSKLIVDRRLTRDVALGLPKPPQWVGLRFFNVYGPGESHKAEMRSVINKIFPDVLIGRPVSLFKSYRPEFADGEQCRDFVYVDDCVATIEWLIQNPQVSGLFNIGSGISRSFKDLACAVSASIGVEVKIQFIDMPPVIRDRYQYYTKADMNKLRSMGFNLAPTLLEDGIEKYVKGHLLREF